MRRLSSAACLAAGLLCLAPAAAHASHRVAVPISGAPGNVSAQFLAASTDGSKVLFGTTQAMLPSDQDATSDIYQREGGRLTLISAGDGGSDDPQPAQFMTATPSLSRVIWQSKEDVTGTDFDLGQPDLFKTTNGQTTQLTQAQIPSFSSVDPFFLVTISADGSRVGFQTNQQLVFADNDGGAADVYENVNGLVRLASAGGSGPVSLRAMSSDGSRLFMSTTAQLIGTDTDAATDLYERVNGTTTNLLTPGTGLAVEWAGASADGSHVYFHTSESLNAVLDADARRDVYERAGSQTVLLSTSATAGNGAFDASFQRASADGTRVIFTTMEALDPSDQDGQGGDPYDDIYLRTAGVTTMVTAGDTFDSPVIVSEMSPDGLNVFWWSNQTFADDEDAGYADAWRWNDGTIMRISVGEQDDQGDHDAFYAGRAADNSSFVFQSEGQLTADDTDSHDDLYLRTGATTRLLSPTPAAPCTVEPVSSRCIPAYKGVSADGARIWFAADENLHPADGDVVVDDPATVAVREDQSNTDVYESRVLGAPTVDTTAATNAYIEGDPAPIDPELTITESSDDIFGATVEITAGFEPTDVLAFVDLPGFAGSLNAAGDKLTLTGRGTVGDFQDALRSVTYSTSSETPSAATRTIEFTVDNGGHSGSGARSLTVTAANDVPALAPGAGPADYIEGAGEVAIAPELTASDADSTTLAGATVRIVDGFAEGEDVVSLTAGSGIAGEQDGDTLTLTGTATLAQYEAVLRTVTYENVSEDPTELTRVLELVVTDGEGHSTPVYIAFGVFQRSVDATNATLTYAENAPSTVVDPGVAITNFDPELVQGATAEITQGFTAGEDVLAFADTAAITGTLLAGGRKLTLAGEATIADYVAALRSVTYRNVSEAPSGAHRIVTFTVVDGLGSDARRIDVVPVDDAPVLVRGAAGEPFVENGLPATIAAALSVSDVDSSQLSAAVAQIEAGLQAGADELVTTEKLPDGITGQWDPAAATFTLTGGAPLDDYVSALRSLALTNDSEDPSAATRTVSFVVSSAGAPSNAVALGIGVTPVNDAPEVGVSGTPLAYTAGDDPVAVDASMTLADPDSTIQGATVKLVTGQQEGEDVLETSDRDDGITVSIDAAEQTATLAGPASVAAYRTALREVMYSNRSAAATGERVVRVLVTDGPSVSAADFRTITLGVRAPQAADAPTIAGVARVGAVLTASSGDWTGSEPMTLSPQWQRCTGSGTGCSDIAAATGLTYVPGAADVDLRLRLLVVADNMVAGTTSAASLPTAAVRIALAAPQVLTAPSSPTSADSASIRFGGEDGATFSCAVDGAPFAPCPSPLSLAGLADGEHALHVRQHREGLASPASERRWTIDTLAPAAPTLLAGPDPITALRTATIAFAGEPGARFDCALDDADPAACTSPVSIAELGIGAHGLRVRAIDAAGNASAPLRTRWTVGDPPAAARASKLRLRSASALSRGARTIAVGCALDAGVLRRCEVVARVQQRGHLVRVGRGVVVPKVAQRSASLRVRFTATGRRLLLRMGAGSRIRLTGFARTTGAPSRLVDTAMVRVR